MAGKETILMGMSGGIYSYVSAFLLKKQGYNIITSSILFPSEHNEHSFFSKYYLTELQSIKDFATEMGVPFYGINGQSIFKDKIVERMIAAKLSGRYMSYKQHETLAIFDLLIEKANALGATKISTAHYAKSIFNRKFSCYQLYNGNELETDHSFYLSFLTEKHLSRCYFPLADMKKSEILKVYSMMGGKAREFPSSIDLQKEPQFLDLLENTSAASLRKKGIFINVHTGNNLGEHHGIHKYYLGQNKLKNVMNTNLDHELEVLAINPVTGKITVGHSIEFKYKYLMISNVHITAAQNISIPIIGFLKCEQIQNELIPCTIYMKNNSVCEIMLNKQRQGVLFTGQHVVIYEREKGNSRIILSGNLDVAGIKVDNKIIPTYLSDEEIEKLNSTDPLNFL